MLETHDLLRFFQHAHNRVEGWLMDFQDSLSDSRPCAEFFDRAVEELRRHMFVEEELIFPLAKEELAGPVGDLLEEHGRISDLVEQLAALLRHGSDPSEIRTFGTRLMGLLAAHTAEEDLGIYPDLLARLSPDEAQAHLAEAETMEAPPGWVSIARRLEG